MRDYLASECVDRLLLLSAILGLVMMNLLKSADRGYVDDVPVTSCLAFAYIFVPLFIPSTCFPCAIICHVIFRRPRSHIADPRGSLSSSLFGMQCMHACICMHRYLNPHIYGVTACLGSIYLDGHGGLHNLYPSEESICGNKNYQKSSYVMKFYP